MEDRRYVRTLPPGGLPRKLELKTSLIRHPATVSEDQEAKRRLLDKRSALKKSLCDVYEE